MCQHASSKSQLHTDNSNCHNVIFIQKTVSLVRQVTINVPPGKTKRGDRHKTNCYVVVQFPRYPKKLVQWILFKPPLHWMTYLYIYPAWC